MSHDNQTPHSGSDRTGLLARVLGIFISPRETFAGVIARPQWFDVALVTTLVAIVATAGFLATDVGRLAVLDQQVRQTESLGVAVTDQMYARLEGMQRYMPYLAGGGILAGWPLGWLVLSGILVAVFNGWLGGEATFRQVFAVVVHCSVIRALQAAFVAPLNYARESTGGATSLGVFFPMLGEGSFLARLLGGIDLFTVWWVVVLSTGLSVLYQKRTGSIAVWFLGLYAAGALALAAIQTIRGGA
jgi:hypothetical protein